MYNIILSNHNKAVCVKTIWSVVLLSIFIISLTACSHQTTDMTVNNSYETSLKTEQAPIEPSQTQSMTSLETMNSTIHYSSADNVHNQNKILLNTQLNEQKGTQPISVSAKAGDKIVSLLSQLQLSYVEKPQSKQFPIGGGIILYCYNNDSLEDKFILYAKDIIELNGNYYKDNSNIYDDLIELISGILYS